MILYQIIRINFTFLKKKIICQKSKNRTKDHHNQIIHIQNQIYIKGLKWELLKEADPKFFLKVLHLKTSDKSKVEIQFKNKMATLWPSSQAIWWIFNNKMFKTKVSVAQWVSIPVDKLTHLVLVLVLNLLELN